MRMVKMHAGSGITSRKPEGNGWLATYNSVIDTKRNQEIQNQEI